MNYEIPVEEFPSKVAISSELIPEERPKEVQNHIQHSATQIKNPAFHEKSEKNSKENLGGSYKRKMEKKYKKPKSRGDKFKNKNKRK